MSVSQVHYDPVKKVINGGEIFDPGFDNRGLGWLLFDSMKKWGEKECIAQIDALTGFQDTFDSLLMRSIRAAISMQKQLGVKKGDIILLCTMNHVNSVVPLIASYFIGAVTAPADPYLSIDDIIHLLNMVKPKFIFTGAECEELIERALQNSSFDCKIVTFSHVFYKFQTFDSLLEKQDNEKDFKPEFCDDLGEVCLILFSSGTTGLPKGICINHKFIMNAANGMSSIKNTGTTFLGFASLYWISTMMIVSTCLIFGYKRLLCPSFRQEWVCDIIETYQVSFMFIAPVQAIRTVPYLKNKGKSLKYIMIGGGAIAPDYLLALRNAFPDAMVVNNYGQTEIGCISALKEKNENYKKLATCGQPVAGLKLRIVDPDTEQVLDLNQEGEIRIKPMCPINGYYKRDSSDVWDEEGFMKTGDIGYFDDDLCLFVTDRVKEMFKYMSYHIVPSKLEMILQCHPAVELAFVIGVPHSTDDNHALGIVTLQPGAYVTSRELELYVEGRVDERNRLRAGVMIVESGALPMTPTGKVRRRDLKELVMIKTIESINGYLSLLL